MNASKTLQYLDRQKAAIEALVAQLDEVQVAFNAQFDEFKTWHDQTLDRLIDLIASRMGAIPPQLRAAIDERQPEERKRIDERRQKVREEHLPRRQQAADALLNKAQAEMAELRELNPQLDAREERLKSQKVELEALLEELNTEIRQKSRALGVVWHFVAITKADRERQRIIGRLEETNSSLYDLRRIWEEEQKKTAETQAAYQKQWQLESMAVARLQSELEQLDDEVRCEDLSLRRAVRHVVDALKEPSPCSDLEIYDGLREMMELNVQTDDYHAGLASVGGMIGLLRGINSGMAAIHKSIEGLEREQRMHSSYLKPLKLGLPDRVEAFHKQWPDLAKQFADEKTIGAHPADFAATVNPLLEGPLSEPKIEAMFKDLGAMIQRATADW